MKKSTVPASIESQQTRLSGLNIVPTPHVIELEGFDEPLFSICVERRGNAKIQRELVPKKAKICTDSMLDAGDTISGIKLHGFTADIIRRDDIVVGQAGRSSAHSGQHLDESAYCFMQIVSDWQNNNVLKLADSVDPQILEKNHQRD